MSFSSSDISKAARRGVPGSPQFNDALLNAKQERTAAAAGQAGGAWLFRLVANPRDFTILGRDHAAVAWLRENGAPVDGHGLRELRKLNRPFGQDHQVIAGYGSREELIFILVKRGNDPWETTFRA